MPALSGRAYVHFALDEPVYFRLMFRPELTDAKRFPGLERARARAFAVLRGLVDALPATRTSASRTEAVVSMHWSLAHGLATLLLDGPLGVRFTGGEERERHVNRVLRLSSSKPRCADVPTLRLR